MEQCTRSRKVRKAQSVVKFEDNAAVKPDPDGGVELQWQRFDSRQGWVPYSGLRRGSDPGPPTYVQHYTTTQSVSIKDSFPNPGKYRVRALASPVSVSHPWWTPWREFSIILVDPSLIQKKIIKP